MAPTSPREAGTPDRVRAFLVLLVTDGLITKEEEAVCIAETMERASLRDVLIMRHVMTNETFSSSAALSVQATVIDLQRFSFDPRAVLVIPEVTARTFRMLVVEEDATSITVVIDNPLDGTPVAELARFISTRIRVAVPIQGLAADDVSRYYEG